ncbi:hypothetical protein [Enhygromyxa salina]|uniref:hypothetical protein n=1 Tax=Enhygromyxa salina TaxID=215803 RepID=UPI0011B27F0E|nr:hypothetical protein [Enhygromyxa salina]
MSVATRSPSPWLAWLCLLAAGLLGCLRAFGPDLHTRGIHAGVTPADTRDTCMTCHESETDALARMKGPKAGPADAPIVGDWMMAEARECTVCHVVRGDHAR